MVSSSGRQPSKDIYSSSDAMTGCTSHSACVRSFELWSGVSLDHAPGELATIKDIGQQGIGTKLQLIVTERLVVSDRPFFSRGNGPERIRMH